MSKVFSVAIDGPVGAGKSCVAKKVAERLNAAYLDTGAMYRAVGLYMLENGVSLEDGAAIAENAGKARVDVRYEGREQRTYLNGRDVTGELRRPEVSLASSAVAKVHAGDGRPRHRHLRADGRDFEDFSHRYARGAGAPPVQADERQGRAVV